MKKTILWMLLLFFLGCYSLHSSSTYADGYDVPGISVKFTGEKSSSEDISKSFQILVLLTALSILPAMLIVLTAFTRIIIVLSMLRQAIGLQNIPPNIVIINLALFLTFFTMSPVISKINNNALQPFLNEKISSKIAAEKAIDPLREFMIRQTREKDLLLMVELAKDKRPKKFSDISNTVLIPAFMLSELQTAFQIGFVIFLPFLLIDLVVASVLMSMGMMMVPPLTISLPVKILMFVLIDGWALIAKSLVGSFVF